MGFSKLKVVVNKEEEGKYIFVTDWCATYAPHRNYECKHSALTPHLGEKLLVFMMNDFYDVFKFGTVIATVNGMTIQNWINEIPRMEISSIVNNEYILDFLDMVKSQYSIDVDKTKVTMTNLKRAVVKLESSCKTMEEREWLLSLLSTLQFIHNKYGRGIK